MRILVALALLVGCAPTAQELAARQAARERHERQTAEMEAEKSRAIVERIVKAAADECTSRLPDSASEERRSACVRAESKRMVDEEIARIERRTDAEIAANLAARQTAAMEENARHQRAMQWSAAMHAISAQLNPPAPPPRPVYVAPTTIVVPAAAPAPAPVNCSSYVVGPYVNTNCY